MLVMVRTSDEQKTKEELLKEVIALRTRVAELEGAASEQGEIFHIFRNSTPIGLFIVQDGKFKFLNENFRGVTRGTTDNLIDTNPMNIVLPEDRWVLRENAIKMLKGERTTPYKYRIITRDGSVRWMLEGVASIMYQGRRAVLGHSMDITELEQAQQKLEESLTEEKRLRKELEAEVQRRILFAHALVHELKTPLTPIMSSSELLVSELNEEPWVSVARNIHRGALNLSKRIDELLDLARGEIGALKINPRHVDILQLLNQVAEDMAVVTVGNGQELIAELPPYLPTVWADEDRLRQIVLNLLINATKYTPEKGKITLRARDEINHVVVEVQDTGPGIPKSEQHSLFLPYSRPKSVQDNLSGLGLGLALCKIMVELHGGKIWVNSDKGKGAIFAFSIPLKPAQKEGNPAK